MTRMDSYIESPAGEPTGSLFGAGEWAPEYPKIDRVRIISTVFDDYASGIVIVETDGGPKAQREFHMSDHTR
jgi:hypothetical protein